jgi:hypothetical protein
MQGLHGAWGNQPRLRFAQHEWPLQIWVRFHLDVAPLPARETSPGSELSILPRNLTTMDSYLVGHFCHETVEFRSQVMMAEGATITRDR